MADNETEYSEQGSKQIRITQAMKKALKNVGNFAIKGVKFVPNFIKDISNRREIRKFAQEIADKQRELEKTIDDDEESFDDINAQYEQILKSIEDNKESLETYAPKDLKQLQANINYLNLFKNIVKQSDDLADMIEDKEDISKIKAKSAEIEQLIESNKDILQKYSIYDDVKADLVVINEKIPKAFATVPSAKDFTQQDIDFAKKISEKLHQNAPTAQPAIDISSKVLPQTKTVQPANNVIAAATPLSDLLAKKQAGDDATIKEIKVSGGLDDTVAALKIAKANGEHVFCIYNGHKLTSDNITLDSAYKEVTGYSAEEWHKHFLERYKKQDELKEMKKELKEYEEKFHFDSSSKLPLNIDDKTKKQIESLKSDIDKLEKELQNLYSAFEPQSKVSVEETDKKVETSKNAETNLSKSLSDLTQFSSYKEYVENYCNSKGISPIDLYVKTTNGEILDDFINSEKDFKVELAKQKEIIRINNELTKLNQEKNNKIEDIEQLKKQIAEISTNAQNIQQSISEIDKQIEELNSKLSESKTETAKIETKKDGKENISKSDEIEQTAMDWTEYQHKKTAKVDKGLDDFVTLENLINDQKLTPEERDAAQKALYGRFDEFVEANPEQKAHKSGAHFAEDTADTVTKEQLKAARAQFEKIVQDGQEAENSQAQPRHMKQ